MIVIKLCSSEMGWVSVASEFVGTCLTNRTFERVAPVIILKP